MLYNSIFDELLAILNYDINFDLDNSKILGFTYDDLISKKDINYVGYRSGILHLSKLIEQYAIEKKVPLLIDIQNDKRFLLSENRMKNIFKQVPSVSMIGNFSEDLKFDSNVKIINCGKNALEKNWIVLTKDDDGLFGLVTEQIDDKSFRGFYSGNSEIMEPLIKIISNNLNFDIQI